MGEKTRPVSREVIEQFELDRVSKAVRSPTWTSVLVLRQTSPTLIHPSDLGLGGPRSSHYGSHAQLQFLYAEGFGNEAIRSYLKALDAVLSAAAAVGRGWRDASKGSSRMR